MTNVRAFKDGNRLVIVIEDAGNEMEKWVKGMIAGDIEAVRHLAPPPPMGKPEMKTEEMEEIEPAATEKTPTRTAKFLQEKRTDGLRTINVSQPDTVKMQPAAAVSMDNLADAEKVKAVAAEEKESADIAASHGKEQECSADSLETDASQPPSRRELAVMNVFRLREFILKNNHNMSAAKLMGMSERELRTIAVNIV